MKAKLLKPNIKAATTKTPDQQLEKWFASLLMVAECGPKGEPE
jgi:hypothetical protein